MAQSVNMFKTALFYIRIRSFYQTWCHLRLLLSRDSHADHEDADTNDNDGGRHGHDDVQVDPRRQTRKRWITGFRVLFPADTGSGATDTFWKFN